MIIVDVIDAKHDLKRLVAEINSAAWDDANDMGEYEAAALREYVGHQDTIFIACHDVSDGDRTLLGIASARLEIKPYDRSRWLYVDEVDVCADKRRRGAGKAMMQRLLEIAQAAGCTEVWLGTEVTNQAAKALYRSLDPDEVAEFVGYTYELTD